MTGREPAAAMTVLGIGGTLRPGSSSEQALRIEACLAPTGDGGVYYTGPSENWSRPGRMWWSVPEGIEEFSTWQEISTIHHEGVPGHHLQIAERIFHKDRLNRWQRRLSFVSGHGEGWALHAERLMDELGYLKPAGARIGSASPMSP